MYLKVYLFQLKFNIVRGQITYVHFLSAFSFLPCPEPCAYLPDCPEHAKIVGVISEKAANLI